VLALVIQLVIAGFSSFLVVGLTSLYDPGGDAADVVVGVTGEEADALVAAAAEVEGLEPRRYGSVAAADRAFRRGEIAAVADAEERNGRIEVAVEAPASDVRKTLVVVRVRAALEALERNERESRSAHLSAPPVSLPPGVDASPYFGFSYAILVPLLVLLPAFISGSVVVDSLTEEIERGTATLLLVAPVSVVEVLDGKAGVMAALAPASVGLWVVLLEANGIAVANLAPVLAVAAAVAVLFVTFGAAIAFAVPVRQRAQLTYSLGAVAALAAASLLPEHPATTISRFAIGSPSLSTYAHLAGYLAAAAVAAVALRRYVARIDPERLG